MDIKKHLVEHEVLDVKDTAFNDNRYVKNTGEEVITGAIYMDGVNIQLWNNSLLEYFSDQGNNQTGSIGMYGGQVGQYNFYVGGGNDGVLNFSNITTSTKTYTFPDFNGTFALLEVANTFSDTTTTTGRKQAVAIKSSNYTLTNNDEVVVFTSTSTATLPQATGSGQTYRIICRSGTLTVDGNGTETVKGELTQTLFAGEDLIITDTESGIWE